MNIILKLTIALTVLGVAVQINAQEQSIDHWETAIFASDTWSYFVGTNEPPSQWAQPTFNDSGWLTGPGGFGYGDDDDGIMIGQTISVYLRTSFNVSAVAHMGAAILHLDYDDGFVANLNGVEIARAQLADGIPAHNRTTVTDHESGSPEAFHLDETELQSLLVEGRNVLAVQVHNVSSSSSNLSSNVFLSFGITDEGNYYRSVPDWFQEPQEFGSSNLPIFVIDTNGGEILDEPKINAHMGIVYNGPGNRNYVTDPFNNYDGNLGIELRGNTTQFFPKKPYMIETRDAEGENLNVSILGLPEENDWILRAAYNDKTLIRDALALWMARSLGNYASRTAHVELILNGAYQGIYILQEQIKPDKNRLNIAKLLPEDNSGDEITGGYIYEVAKGWVPVDESLSRTEGDTRRIKYPKSHKITDEQRAYIAKYDDDFRALMEQPNFADPVNGYAAWIDVESFIDEILVQETTRNSDAYGWSSHFHKDRMGKLQAGPAWDFDQALSNSTFMSGDRYEDWLIDKTSDGIWSWGGPYPQFWLRLFYEPSFRYQLSARWFEMREGAWSTPSLLNVIDSLTTQLEEAQARNFEKWPILGVEVWRSLPGWQERDTYAKEVDYLKSFLINRLEWMDDQLLDVNFASQAISSDFAITVYPNPVRTQAILRYKLPMAGASNIVIYNLLGQEIKRINLGHQRKGDYQLLWDGNDSVGRRAANGIYLISIQVGSKVKTSKASVLR